MKQAALVGISIGGVLAVASVAIEEFVRERRRRRREVA